MLDQILYKWFDFIRPISTGKDMVIVAGMPKSGTTVIAKLLGEAIGKSVCSDPFYQLDTMKVNFRNDLYDGKLALRALWSRYKKVFSGIVIKDPNFAFLIQEIKTTFPEAKLVFIVRDPRDNIRSILNRLKLPGDPNNANLEVIRKYTAWFNLLAGKVPYIQGENYIEVLSWRWKKVAETFLEFQREGIEIRYEDFCKNKNNAILDLGRKLGFTELSDVSHLVNIQYQPKGDTSVNLEEFFGKKQLDVIERITGSVLREFGYEAYSSRSS